MKTVRISIILIGATPLWGCLNSIDEGINAEISASQETKQEVIVGELDWVGTETLPSASDEAQNAASVGYLSIPAKGNRCTAFLVAEDMVMTNEHCISDDSEAQGATVAFRYESGVPFAQRATYNCSTFVGDNAVLDYALLRCEGSPGLTHGVVDLDTLQNQAVRDDLYVVQQNCDYYSIAGCAPTKKISRGQITQIDSEYRHNADTLGGSSGSPVFADRTHRVVALHHVGIGNNGDGRGLFNYAVPMGTIVSDVLANFPDVTLAGIDPIVAQPVVDDGFEPNNGFDAASALGASFHASDLSITVGDVDIFRIDVETSATLDVDAQVNAALGNLDVHVYRAGVDAPVARGETLTNNETLTLAVEPGVYYVAVFSFQNAANTYALTVSTTASASSPAEQNAPTASEPGNDLLGARTVSLPYAASEAIGNGDEDFFRIENDGVALDIRIDFAHAEGDLDLYVYAIDGSLLGQSTSVSNDEAVILPGHTGAVFVRVLGYQGAIADYDIEISPAG